MLKSERFQYHSEATKFINDNDIKREDILNLIVVGIGTSIFYTIFYYDN